MCSWVEDRAKRPAVRIFEPATDGCGGRAEGWHPARVLAGAAGHDHLQVLGLRGQRTVVAPAGERLGAIGEAAALYPFRRQPADREATVLPEEALDIGLGVAVDGDLLGVLGAKRHHRGAAAARHVVAARLG